jgi:hypothetical protein
VGFIVDGVNFQNVLYDEIRAIEYPNSGKQIRLNYAEMDFLVQSNQPNPMFFAWVIQPTADVQSSLWYTAGERSLEAAIKATWGQDRIVYPLTAIRPKTVHVESDIPTWDFYFSQTISKDVRHFNKAIWDLIRETDPNDDMPLQANLFAFQGFGANTVTPSYLCYDQQFLSYSVLDAPSGLSIIDL